MTVAADSSRRIKPQRKSEIVPPDLKWGDTGGGGRERRAVCTRPQFKKAFRLGTSRGMFAQRSSKMS